MELLKLDADDAIERLSEHQVSLVDYDYARVNEDSRTDEQVAVYTNRKFGSLTEIMVELQQQDFPEGVPRDLLNRLADDHLRMNPAKVETALEEYIIRGRFTRTSLTTTKPIGPEVWAPVHWSQKD